MKRILLLFIAGAAFFNLKAQFNSMAFPSANNSFLGNVSGESGIGVDLYTGTAQVNMPICALASKDLNIPVALSYTGGRGIKIQDYATPTGLGWQLNAGGGISRVVRGFPDEFYNGYLGTGQWGVKVLNWQGNGGYISNADQKAISGNDGMNPTTVPTADGEPDIFYVKTPFFALQFLFDETGTPVFSNSTGFKITSYNFYNSSNYQNAYFIVTDEAGNKYSFGTTSSAVEKTTTDLYGTSYTFPTTWYLTSISTFNSKDNINFTYVSFSDVISKHYQTSKTTWGGCTPDINSVPQTITTVQPKYIASIQSAIGQVDFTYALDRRDLTTAPRLSSVSLKVNVPGSYAQLQNYTFTYSYFGDPSTDINILRLRLDNIKVAGNTPTTATPVILKSFTYNTTENLPSRTSQVFDFWGYYTAFTPINGSTDPMDHPELRVPNESKTKANILTGVTDISGASWQITYEQNYYYRAATTSNVAVGGLRVKTLSQTLPAGDNLQTNYVYNDATAKSTGQILTPSYPYLVLIINSTQRVLSETPSNIYDINGTFIGYSTVKTTGSNGGYVITDFTNFSDAPDLLNYLNSVNPDVVTNVTSSISLAYKRGLIKSQAIFNSAGIKLSEDINNYTSLNTTVLKKAWAYHWYFPSVFLCSNGGNVSLNSTYWTNVENYRLSSVTHKDYDQVTVANSIQNVTNYTYCPNKRSVKAISTTDSKNNTVTKTYYHADDLSVPMVTPQEQTAITNLINANATAALIHETDTKGTATAQVHNSFTTYPNYNNTYLSSTSAYKGASTLLNQQFFSFDPSTSNMVTSNVDGGKSTAIIYGYNSTMPIAKIVNATSSYTSSTAVSSANDYLTLGTAKTFTTSAVGTIRLSLSGGYPGPSFINHVHYSLSGASSNSGDLCMSFGPTCNGVPNFIDLPNMPVGTYNITINSSDNPSNNPNVSYTYPVTVPVISNIINEFFYEGFEQNYPGVVSGNAHTGNYYFTATPTPYTVNFTLPNSRQYVIQWWNWVQGKWIFNEQSYTGPTTLSGIIDNVRIFPKDAQITTYSYNPLIGKTGETDVSGRSINYEYDGLGRQNIVRDNDKNILSKFCYNFAGQTINCTAASSYTNTLQSRSFTRNNCAAGLVGSAVTYSVPANTYSSFLSQADADQQAINEINLNGQVYANNPVNGATCSYGNVVQSGPFTRTNCGLNYTGGTVTYTIPANTYFSTISQADADQKAYTALQNNGPAYANNPANGATCTPNISMTGPTGYYSGLTSGNGTISAPPGYTVRVNISANGSPGTFSLTMSVTGVAISGSSSVTNGSSFFTFVMPASGTVNWSATFSMPPGSSGGGSIGVQ